MASDDVVRIVFLAHTPMSSPSFRVGSHFLARELTNLGHCVVHIPPARVRWRRPMYRTRVGIHNALGVYEIEFRSLLPYGEVLRLCRSGSFVDRIVSRCLTKQFVRLLPESTVDVVVVDKISTSTIAKQMNVSAVVYRPTDLFVYDQKSPLYCRQRELVESSSAVVATSPFILSYLEDEFGAIPNQRVIVNGADIQRLGAQRTTSSHRRCVYVGAIDDRFDIGFVIEASTQLPEWRFDLYGPISVSTPEGLSNVTFHGSLHPDELGAELAGATVAVLPFRVDHDRNRGRAPMKYYEYLALGLPIVGPRLPELVGRADGMYFAYDNNVEIGAMIEMAAASPVTVQPAALMQFDWATISKDFANYLESILG